MEELEAGRLLVEHKIDYDPSVDPRTIQEVAVQIVLTDTVSLEDYTKHEDLIRSTILQQA